MKMHSFWKYCWFIFDFFLKCLHISVLVVFNAHILRDFPIFLSTVSLLPLFYFHVLWLQWDICCHPYLCSSLCNMLLVLWLPLIFFSHWFKEILLCCIFIFFNVSCIWGLLSFLYLYMYLFYLLIICKLEDLDIIVSNISLFFFSLLFGIEIIFTVYCLKWFHIQFSSVQLSRSVTSNSLRPHEPPCPSSTPGDGQTHVHWVGDAIQPSYPLSSLSSPALNLS